MQLDKLTFFILALNMALDTGYYGDIYIDEVKERIERGDLMPYLRERLGGDGVRLRHLNENDDVEITERFRATLSAYAGDELKTWGVSNSGLCLLIAWTLDIINWEYGSS